jgi:hypothetical protein
VRLHVLSDGRDVHDGTVRCLVYLIENDDTIILCEMDVCFAINVFLGDDTDVCMLWVRLMNMIVLMLLQAVEWLERLQRDLQALEQACAGLDAKIASGGGRMKVTMVSKQSRQRDSLVFGLVNNGRG